MKTLKKRVLILALCAAFAVCSGIAAAGLSGTSAAEGAEAKVYMQEGASVRAVETNPGIRFTGFVANDLFEGNALGENVTAGMLIIPTEILGENELTAKTASVLDISAQVFDFAKKTDTHTPFNAVVTDIPALHYGTSLTARAYVNENGEYTYAETTAVRDISQVSAAALTDETAEWSDAQYGMLIDYVMHAGCTTQNLEALEAELSGGLLPVGAAYADMAASADFYYDFTPVSGAAAGTSLAAGFVFESKENAQSLTATLDGGYTPPAGTPLVLTFKIKWEDATEAYAESDFDPMANLTFTSIFGAEDSFNIQAYMGAQTYSALDGRYVQAFVPFVAGETPTKTITFTLSGFTGGFKFTVYDVNVLTDKAYIGAAPAENGFAGVPAAGGTAEYIYSPEDFAAYDLDSEAYLITKTAGEGYYAYFDTGLTMTAGETYAIGAGAKAQKGEAALGVASGAEESALLSHGTLTELNAAQGWAVNEDSYTYTFTAGAEHEGKPLILAFGTAGAGEAAALLYNVKAAGITVNGSVDGKYYLAGEEIALPQGESEEATFRYYVDNVLNETASVTFAENGEHTFKLEAVMGDTVIYTLEENFTVADFVTLVDRNTNFAAEEYKWIFYNERFASGTNTLTFEQDVQDNAGVAKDGLRYHIGEPGWGGYNFLYIDLEWLQQAAEHGYANITITMHIPLSENTGDNAYTIYSDYSGGKYPVYCSGGTTSSVLADEWITHNLALSQFTGDLTIVPTTAADIYFAEIRFTGGTGAITAALNSGADFADEKYSEFNLLTSGKLSSGTTTRTYEEVTDAKDVTQNAMVYTINATGIDGSYYLYFNMDIINAAIEAGYINISYTVYSTDASDRFSLYLNGTLKTYGIARSGWTEYTFALAEFGSDSTKNYIYPGGAMIAFSSITFTK